MPVSIDTLQYARLLIDAGFEQKQAEAQAFALNQTFREHVPSKEDVEIKVKQAKTDIKEQVATKEGVNRSIEVAKNEINARIDKKVSEVKLEISEVKSGMRVLTWMVGFMFAMMSAIFVKLFVG